MILLILSFVAGILTILAPCVLPLLPVIVGSSVDGGINKKKAFTITASLGISVIAFTFLLKVSTLFINIEAQKWSIFSGLIIFVFGLISLFPNLWEKMPFVNKLNRDSNKLLAKGYKKQSFWGDVIIGASLGPVFSTCSPTYFVILATVVPQSLLLGLVYLLAYSIGLSGSLLLVAYLGQKITSRFAGLSDTHGKFKRGLGAVFVVLGILIVFGQDKIIEAKILSLGFFDVTTLEQKLLQLNDSNKNSSLNRCDNGVCFQATTTGSNKQIVTSGPKAPEFVNPSGYINTDGKAIKLGDYKGKNVVLLDVWTYSCINCQRTLPYITSWYSKYKDQGLVVIGIHTPEFAFEKIQQNVEDAVKRFGITYPVIMDNNYATWNAYGNQYWPRKYLINVNGEVIFDHIGEGNYEQTEKEIVKALSELNNKDISVKSPEIYFGSLRTENIASLVGEWNIKPEYAESAGPGSIKYNYDAKNVYMVLSSSKAMSIEVYVDGKLSKTLTVKDNKLYTLVEGADYGKHSIEIKVPGAGLDVYTFTFG